MKEFATIRKREAILKEERIKIEKDKEQRKREELDIYKMKTMFDMLQTLKNSPTPLTLVEEAYKNFFTGPSSSSSSSSSSSNTEEYDQLVDELFTYQPPSFLMPQTQSQPTTKTPKGGANRRDREMGHARDAAGRLGLSPLQKCTAAKRMLAYGMAADTVDEYVRISQSTARVALQCFCAGVIDQFRTEYLRNPTTDDLARILHQNELRGFPSMIGSIDCMHWEWKNCPTAWKAQYAGRNKKATLILEAVADQDLWIWHSFFGIPGSYNDLNVLYRSPVFDEVLHGRVPPVNFTVNGHEYNMAYYLADDIYPKWATFIQGITYPQLQKDKMFADHQAAARKDVERAFGVLQARFAIIRKPSLAYDEDILRDIMKECIIMHNMIIVEDERHNYTRGEVLRSFYEADQQELTPASTSTTPLFEFNVGRPTNFDFNSFLQ
ncbi:protein ALP1-like [Chenopodium quinoa]|uniref:protein ALP1-like n=1 Tax=Chenopodium quinoa TaxID=63459 RepID=UPI000B79471D|nr:protein ALP1-like [Chenopodium quinoa]